MKKLLDIPVENEARDSNIWIRPVNYLDAKSIASLLNTIKISSQTSQRQPLKILADDTTNSLIVSGKYDAFQAVNRIVRKLDLNRAQVFFEVDILDIDTLNGYQFGASILAGAGGAAENSPKTITGWQAKDALSTVLGSSSNLGNNNSVALGSLANDLTLGIIGAAEVDVAGVGKLSPAAMLKLVKNDQFTEILSSPTLLATDGERSSIVVGETFFYSTAKVNKGDVTGSVEKENVDLMLALTPKVSLSGHLTVDLEFESKIVLGSFAGQPNLGNRKLKHQFSMKNSQTVVIAGLESLFSTGPLPWSSFFLGYTNTRLLL